MALTYTGRGEGARNVASESSYSIVPASNFTAGALAVLCVSYDNAGVSGADPFVSISDTKGNTWVSRQTNLRDPGAANAGVVLRIFTTAQNGGTLTTSDTITVSFGSTVVVARSYTLMEITSNVATPFYVTGNNNAQGSESTTARIVTGSINNGHLVLCCHGAEHNALVTGDTDTTNGIWSVQQTAGVGTGASANQISSQTKVVTATGTQDWQATFLTSAQDWVAAYIEIGEDTRLTPDTATLALTSFAPTVRVTNPVTVTPATATLTLTRFVPTAQVSDHVKITPFTTQLFTTRFVPTVQVSNHVQITPTTATLALTSYAPNAQVSDNLRLTPTTATLVLTSFSPTTQVSDHVEIIPTTATLTLTSYVPNAQVSEDVEIVPDTAILVLTSYAPIIQANNDVLVFLDSTTLTLTRHALTVQVSNHVKLTPNTATLALTSQVPTVQLSNHVRLTPNPLTLVLITYVPSISVSGGSSQIFHSSIYVSRIVR